ncbi:MAG: arginase [Alphaproteobacteria bacterium]
MKCQILGAPVEEGASQLGCLMGPDAYRTAGIKDVLRDLGHEVTDLGNAKADKAVVKPHANKSLRNLQQIAGWSSSLQRAALKASRECDMPIFLGGDHSLSIGTISGVSEYAQQINQPQFVLWLDAHPDMHTLNTTDSGNLHGTPVGYLLGRDSFEGIYPELKAPIKPENVCMMGIRSVDPAERELIQSLPMHVFDMRSIDEIGVKPALVSFLDKVKKANGRLHVSLDVDFLDASIAPAVGTTVPGGATFREAHLIMELLHETGLVTSLDLVELNPFLDERGRTAQLMVDLCASLMGRTVLDRPTSKF